MADEPIARSPIAPAPPVAVVAGWEVSQRRSTSALTLSDRTPLAKVLVHADPGGAYAGRPPSGSVAPRTSMATSSRSGRASVSGCCSARSDQPGS